MVDDAQLAEEVFKIEVAFLSSAKDPAGEGALKALREDLGLKAAESVRTIDAYSVANSGLQKKDAELVAGRLFCDPVVQTFSVGKPLAQGCDWVVEVGFKRGVTDSVGLTALVGIEDVLGKKLPLHAEVRTSKIYCIKGKLSKEEVERACKELLANGLIQNFSIKKLP